jgi:lambda family phage portal protein
MDADQIDPQLTRTTAGQAKILAGIEFDAAGQRVGYHAFKERPGLPLALTSFLDTVRLPAADVVHLFNPLVIGQVRGISWFAPVLLRLHDYDAAIDAQLMRQKISALFAGFIYDANGEAAGFTGEQKGQDILESGLEPGTLKVLPNGKQIVFSDPADLGAEAIGFLKVTAHEIAAGLGIPYEMMTGDANYSSMRSGEIKFRRRVEALQYHVLDYKFCRPIWRRFVTTAVLSGVLDAPGFERDPEPYLSKRSITPRFEGVDAAKDMQADLDSLAGGLMSPRQAAAARGYDLEVLYREISEDRALAESMGLSFNVAPKLNAQITIPPNDTAGAAA